MSPEDCFKCVIPGPGGNNSSCECHIDDVICPGVVTVRSVSTVKQKKRNMSEGHITESMKTENKDHVKTV